MRILAPKNNQILANITCERSNLEISVKIQKITKIHVFFYMF